MQGRWRKKGEKNRCGTRRIQRVGDDERRGKKRWKEKRASGGDIIMKVLDCWIVREAAAMWKKWKKEEFKKTRGQRAPDGVQRVGTLVLMLHFPKRF